MAAAPPVNSAPLHVVSPLVPSNMLSDVCGQQALVKLENTQPSGSFKIRGIGHYIQKSIEKGCDQVISSSGGNAGMAAAYSSKVMEIPATIVIPKSTPSFMVSKLKQEKADVLVHGEVWDVAHKKAITMAENKKCCLVHPFDHPDIWEGHSTIVDEILEQSMEPPAAIVVSVGGGGLLCGILSGLLKHGATDIPVVAMETEGANCLRAALDAGKPVSIGEITSREWDCGQTRGPMKRLNHCLDRFDSYYLSVNSLWKNSEINPTQRRKSCAEKHKTHLSRWTKRVPLTGPLDKYYSSPIQEVLHGFDSRYRNIYFTKFSSVYYNVFMREILRQNGRSKMFFKF